MKKNYLLNQLSSSLSSPVIASFLIFFSIIIVYGTLFFNQHQFLMDDHVILGRLNDVESFKDIFFKNNVDLQPVRDFSLYIDFLISKKFFFEVYHLSSLLIFSLSTVIFYHLLLILKINPLLSLIFALLLGVHPVNVIAVCWISARKHLLSNFFILLSLLIFCSRDQNHQHNGRPQYLKGTLFLLSYIMSCLAQPISAFLPLWTMWQDVSFKKWRLEIKSSFFYFSLFALLLGGLIILANGVYYYKYLATIGQQGIHLKYNYYTIRAIPLMFGRYFYNVINPYDQAVYYLVSSYENIFGTITFGLFFYYLYKTKKFLRPWLLLYILALAPVTFHLLTSFVSNTYALFSSSLLVLIIALWLQDFLSTSNWKEKFYKQFPHPLFAPMHIEKLLLSATMLVLVLCSVRTYQDCSLWDDSIKVFKESFKREAEVNMGVAYITNQLARDLSLKKFKVSEEKMQDYVLTFLELKRAIRETYEYTSNSVYIIWFNFANFVLNAENLNIKAKIKILKLVEDPLILYSNYGLLLAQMTANNPNQVEQYLTTLTRQLHGVVIPQFPKARYESYVIIFDDILRSMNIAFKSLNTLPEVEKDFREQEKRLFPDFSIRRNQKEYQYNTGPSFLDVINK